MLGLDIGSGQTMRRTLLALVLALSLMVPLVPTAVAGQHDEGAEDPRSPTASERGQRPQESTNASDAEDTSSDAEEARPPQEEDPARDDGTESPRPGASDGRGRESGSPVADDQRRSDGRPVDDEDADTDEEESSGRGRGRSDEAREARPGQAFGAFQVNPGSRDVVGDYVAFRYGDASIQNFSVGGTALFDADVEEQEEPETRVKGTVARGSQIRVEMPHYALKAHDNPSGVTRIDTEGGEILLHFTRAAHLTALDNERVRFALGNLTGVVRGDQLSVANGTVRAEGEVLVLLDTPRGRFDVHREALTDAIAARTVGAELSLTKRGDTVEEDSVSYGNVTVTPTVAVPGNVTVLIDGHGFDGRVVVLNVDGTLVGANSEEELRVLFDNMTISRADNLTDVLDPDDDGLQAEYFPVYDPETQTFQLIVSIPHYSVHTLSIGTFVVPVKPSVVVGLLAGVLLLVPSGWALFRRQ